MATNNLFPKKSESTPMIYAYEDKHDANLKGILKVGYTTIGVQERVRQQYNIVRPGEPPYRILVEESAMRKDGTTFLDHDVHRQLKKMGRQHIEGEWYRCTPKEVKAAIEAVSERRDVAWNRDKTFGLRPEQKKAIDMTADFFDNYKSSEAGRVPHFLWNCKMRFGKTFTTYQLALRMKWTRVLVLTFKPAVAHAWEEDLMTEFQNTFYHDYRVIVCAGTRAGIGQQALPPVEKAMSHPDPLHFKTITLTCGMKFATRIPIFMYLTDYREYSLKDVILQLEPKLFERVTGLTKQDFALLVSLNVFNEALMNDAVYKFKRYEDSSLSYSGIDRHEGEKMVGGYSTVITVEEYNR